MDAIVAQTILEGAIFSSGSAEVAQSVLEVGYAPSTGSALVAQSLIEVGYAPSTGSGLVAQTLVEVGYAPSTGSGLVAQTLIEVGYAPSTGSGIVAQVTLEVASEYLPTSYVAHIPIEVAVRPIQAWTDQVVVETAITIDATKARIGQVAVEVAVSTVLTYRVSGTVGGDDISGKVISLRRHGSLCAPAQRAVLELNITYTGSTAPGSEVVLYEDGVKVITGYVIKSTRERPGYTIALDIDDTYHKAARTFIDEQVISTVEHTAAYWIDYLCNRAGASYSLRGIPDTAKVPPGTSLGLRTVHESLTDIMAYASAYVFPNANGNYIIGNVISHISHQFINPISLETRVGDDMTRNVVKVFGAWRASDGTQIRATASTEISGMVPDRTTVIGATLVNDDATAINIASYLVNELGSYDDIATVEILGDPTVWIGDRAQVRHNAQGWNYYTTGFVTSLESEISMEGYRQKVTVGERCPRIAGWSHKLPDPDIWIAAHNRTSLQDPYPEKLAWTEGAQAPEWHLVKTIPHGQIQGMQAMNNSTVYLLMYDGTLSGPAANATALYYSANPKAITPTWTQLLGSSSGSASPVPGLGGELDTAFAGMLPITSLGSDGTKLSLTARYVESNMTKHAFLRYSGATVDISNQITHPYVSGTITTAGAAPSYLGPPTATSYPVYNSENNEDRLGVGPIVTLAYPVAGVPRKSTQTMTGGVRESHQGISDIYFFPAIETSGSIMTSGSSVSLITSGSAKVYMQDTPLPNVTETAYLGTTDHFVHDNLIDYLSIRGHPTKWHAQWVAYEIETTGSGE